jgi:hypothetical protein
MEMQLHLPKTQIYKRSFQITFTLRGSSSDVPIHPKAQTSTAEIKNLKTIGVTGAGINSFI